MTDAPQPAPGGQPAQGPGPQLRVIGQYVKDLSFENPTAPASLRASQTQPNIDLSIDVRAKAFEGETFEVEQRLSAKALRDDQTLFIVELTYAGLFHLTGFNETNRDPILLIECPRILFPFARRILGDATRDGGFPPLMLEPVDFAALYRQQRAQGGAQVDGAGAPPPPADA